MLLKKLLYSPFYLLDKVLFYVAIFFIKLYQYLVSPFFPASCRYTPTCSNYALQSYKTHNVFFASYLVIKRIVKCNPWGGFGYDPVPPAVFSSNCKEKSKLTKSVKEYKE